jgi:hypothetical protein
MGGGLLAVCDPELLEEAWLNHTLTQPGTLDVKIAGRKVRVGSNPGLTQVFPADGIGSLGVPAEVTLQGKASEGSYLYIRAASFKPGHVATGEALFQGLGLIEGGTATIEVGLDHGRVTFALRRPDASEGKPLRWSHLEGPGPEAELPQLPAHYADTPEQGVRTYVAAFNARDGKTICMLWTADVQARFARGRYPCWASVTGLIGYGGESGSPVFKRAHLLRLGGAYKRARYGVTFTAVPVTIRSLYQASRYSAKTETREWSTTIWFRETNEGWRIAKDPLSGGREDASVPPDPYAAQHAREAQRRKEAELRTARRRSLVRLEQAPSCPRGALTLRDQAGDAGVWPRNSADRSRRPAASSDIVAASLALTGRRACFSVTLAGRPLTGSERIELSFLYSSPNSQPSSARFQIDNDYPTADGLHAGLLDPSRGTDATVPAQARVGVDGNTLSASFSLPPSFPTLLRGQFARLGWTIFTTARIQNGAVGVSDRAEGGLTAQKLAAQTAKVQRARQARERAAEQARLSAAWAPARVRLNTGGLRCRGTAVRGSDTNSDVQLMQAGMPTRRHPVLSAVSDVRSARVAISGRHVCFAVSFAKQPFGWHQRRVGLQLALSLTYKTKTAPYLHRIAFGVQTNVQLVNGLTYAGILTPDGPLPANAHVELHGKTLVADFDLDPSFPFLRRARLSGLSWHVALSGTDLRTVAQATPRPLHSHDQLPNNPDRTGLFTSPEIRQSDGKTITPY